MSTLQTAVDRDTKTGELGVSVHFKRAHQSARITVQMCMCALTPVCVHVCVCVPLAHTHTHTHARTHTHTHTHTHMRARNQAWVLALLGAWGFAYN